MIVKGLVRKVEMRDWQGRVYRDIFVLEDGSTDSVKCSWPQDLQGFERVHEGQNVEVVADVSARPTKAGGAYLLTMIREIREVGGAKAA